MPKTEIVKLSVDAETEKSIDADEVKLVEPNKNVATEENIGKIKTENELNSVTKKYSLTMLVTGQGQEVLKSELNSMKRITFYD